MNLAQPTQQTTFLPRRSMGPFTTYVTVEESASDRLSIADHPVQTGAAVSDHAYKEPAKLSIRCIFDRTRSQEPLEATYRKILALQAEREPFTVVTGLRTYENMLFEGLGVVRDRVTSNVLAIDVELREVILVNVAKAKVPPRSRHANPGKTAADEPAGTKQPLMYRKNLADVGEDRLQGPPDKVNSILNTETGIRRLGDGSHGFMGL